MPKEMRIKVADNTKLAIHVKNAKEDLVYE
jgi:hypothetical protein